MASASAPPPPSAGGGLKALFILPERLHAPAAKAAPARVVLAWSPSGALLATGAASGAVRVFDRHGAELRELQLESRAAVLALSWDRDGEALAVLQQGVDRVAHHAVLCFWSINDLQ
jgi:hypothetical protein